MSRSLPRAIALTVALAATATAAVAVTAAAGSARSPGAELPAPRAGGHTRSVAPRALLRAPVLLALGDSLAAGYQPSYATHPPPVDPATGFRDTGYPGSYPADIAAVRHLRVVDLACPGETTSTMTGTPAIARCATTYRDELGASSQLGAATSYLEAHKGTVALVTLDLGANDVDSCASSGRISLSCVQSGEARVSARLPAIVAALRRALAADDPGARLVAMNYYDPFLALAFTPGGFEGAAAAALSLGPMYSFDRRLAQIYGRAHVAVADVASAFRTGRPLPVLTYDGRRLPADVALVCRWTWMCPASRSAASPDIHANTVGYRVIARAFEAVLGPS
ncbi:MAG TPA: SGNH/GDSL hydrolase family protein [Acidimicrobiales bacterium]|nr:SGNH/GDSL hydrolase family protein [Acidimicrobiales bacterium]